MGRETMKIQKKKKSAAEARPLEMKNEQTIALLNFFPLAIWNLN
jgi:hypothetical protein